MSSELLALAGALPLGAAFVKFEVPLWVHIAAPTVALLAAYGDVCFWAGWYGSGVPDAKRLAILLYSIYKVTLYAAAYFLTIWIKVGIVWALLPWGGALLYSNHFGAFT